MKSINRESNLNFQDLIPAKIDRFAKLQRGDPYRFQSWEPDRSGELCLRYSFLSKDGQTILKKKILQSELFSALTELYRTGKFDRAAYAKFCPKSAGSGPCGFAVMGRIMEFLGIAVLQGGRKGFVLVAP